MQPSILLHILQGYHYDWSRKSVLSRLSIFPWPARYLDLSMCDYFQFKSVYIGRPLKLAICNEIAAIPPNMLIKAVETSREDSGMCTKWWPLFIGHTFQNEAIMM